MTRLRNFQNTLLPKCWRSQCSREVYVVSWWNFFSVLSTSRDSLSFREVLQHCSYNIPDTKCSQHRKFQHSTFWEVLKSLKLPVLRNFSGWSWALTVRHSRIVSAPMFSEVVKHWQLQHSVIWMLYKFLVWWWAFILRSSQTLGASSLCEVLKHWELQHSGNVFKNCSVWWWSFILKTSRALDKSIF